MLQRVLEPEVMDSFTEAHDYDAMNHASVNQQFVDDLLAKIAGQRWGETCDVLDLGTGTGQIPVELCTRSEHFRVMATDLSWHMLDVAYANVNIGGHNERIVLELQDAKSLPYEANRFHVVMSNSIIHHVPEPQAVFSEALRMATAGGLLFFRDLARPADKETLGKLVELYAGGENERQQKMFAESLHAALTVAEVQSLVGELGCPPESVVMTSDRHWTWTHSTSEAE